MAGRFCPRCQVAMIVGRRGVELDICVQCGGTWFDHGELTELAKDGPPNVYRLCEKIRAATMGPTPPARGPALCPDCHSPLVKTEHGGMPGVHMEACHHGHGLWVGLYALGQIAGRLAEAAQKAQATRPPAPAARPTPPPAAGPARGGTAPVPQRGGTAPIPPPAGAAAAVPQGVTCKGCGQPNADKAAVCWACGHLLQTVAVDVCPECQGKFHARNWEGIQMCVCDGCGGVWLERDRLGAILFQPPHLQDRLLAEVGKIRTGRVRQFNRALVCPHCHLLLFASPMGREDGQPVHTCPQCRANFLANGVLEELIFERR